ncbi:MAG TPA: histidinol-phosphate transaminase, partial [Bacteroidia bacterium]|nr:histidinol-phosphate transaminase [Bacteroidia bacterium]
MFDLEKILRANIKALVPYSSARDEYKGKAGIFLDANENAYGSPLDTDFNRYPDPLQLELKERLSQIKGLPSGNIFLGNGSDEAIDILYRAVCIPGVDKVIVCPPTYGMYEVAAHINDVEVMNVPLLPETFQLDIQGVLKAMDVTTKLIFICCPNNPTGNGVKWHDVKSLLEHFSGLVVVDEAYINFASYRSLIPELLNYPNLVILQTLSKAWGMAGLRVGMAFAGAPVIDVLNKIKAPYNVNIASQQLALEALENTEQVNRWIQTIVGGRKKLSAALTELPYVLKVYPSDANFLLVRMKDPRKVYNFLAERQIVVRDRSKIP